MHNRTPLVRLSSGASPGISSPALDVSDESFLTGLNPPLILPRSIWSSASGDLVQRLDRFVSPAQLARALGLGESTLKRWIDQGRIPAEKTPGGHRRIRLADALRLVRTEGASAADPAALGFAGSDEAAPEALAATLSSQAPDQALGLVKGLYAGGLAAADLADRWIAPAMARIGHRWAAGRLGVTGEHCATAVMLRALHGLLEAQPAPLPAAPVALIAGLAQDPYLLAPLCAQLVLAEAGFRTVNFGPDTPPASLSTTVCEQRPALVAVSSSVSENTGRRSRAALGAACQEAGSILVVGGRGLRPDVVDEFGATVWCRTMAEFDRFARHVAVSHPSIDLARTA